MSGSVQIRAHLKLKEVNRTIDGLCQWRDARAKKDLPVDNLETAIKLLGEYADWVDQISKKPLTNQQNGH